MIMGHPQVSRGERWCCAVGGVRGEGTKFFQALHRVHSHPVGPAGRDSDFAPPPALPNPAVAH